MNKSLIFLLFVAGLFVTACSDDEPKDNVKEISMSVSSETGINYNIFGADEDFSIECMLVMTEANPGVWVPLPFGAIEGFTYERGHEYELRVKRTILANPPQDGSDRTYSLVRILQDRLVTEPVIPVDKEIKSESDIEYYDLCPIDKYSINTEYLISNDGKIHYADGSALPKYDSARLWLEDILDKADPNWIKFQKIPYMATYSFVLSPLTEEIRLVRNESSGPMFKHLIPEDEFGYIVNTLAPGDELHYTLILANVYKKGIQKLEFLIRKQ